MQKDILIFYDKVSEMFKNTKNVNVFEHFCSIKMWNQYQDNCFLNFAEQEEISESWCFLLYPFWTF